MPSSTSNQYSFDYSTFEIYYLYYKQHFNKTADPLVVFIHWYMVKHNFKCIVDSLVCLNVKLSL